MNGKFCKWCSREGTDSCPENRFTAPLRFCPVENQSGDFEDAAEFEARVAKKLACDEYKTPPGMTPIEAAVWERQKDGTLLMNAKASRLKCARINAEMEEEEIDAIPVLHSH